MECPIKFSIIVPVYKVEKYIDECIQSVLCQSYQNFELILVDDGSPDRSGEICDEYAAKDDRIKVYHKPNGGALQSRCYGLQKASGDYYIFVDSDDYIASNTLEILEKHIRELSVDCIIYGFNWLKASGTEQVLCRNEYTNKLITDKSYLLNIIFNDASYNSLCRKCVKASCFDGRDLSPYFYISSGEDCLQSCEILENAKSFLFIPDALYYYRVNASSVTHSINFDGYKADFTVNEYCFSLLERLNIFAENDYNRHRNFALDALAIELKRISRFCSDKENMVQAFESIRNTEHYANFLSQGYKKAPALPGVIEKSGVRRMFNRLLILALAKKQYAFIIFFSRHIYK